MRMVVVLPAPLGPRKPTISPRATSKLMWSTASTGPKYLVRVSTWIMKRVLCFKRPERPRTWRTLLFYYGRVYRQVRPPAGGKTSRRVGRAERGPPAAPVGLAPLDPPYTG